MRDRRKLWLDTRGVPVITTTVNGERNAERWDWTPATAVPTEETRKMSRDDDLHKLLGDPAQPPAHPPWHRAPAVITDCPHCPEEIGPTVQVDLVGRGWTCSHCGNFTDWTAEVTPLYPKGQDQ